MGRLRDCILKATVGYKEITLREIQKRVAELFPKAKPETLRVNIHKEIKRLVDEGFLIKDGDRLKWTGKEIPQPQPQPQPPAQDVCPNCGKNLEGKLWHKCGQPNSFTNHKKVIVLVKWDGEWLPVSQRFTRGLGTDLKGVLSCEWCGFEFVDFWFSNIHPSYTLFPVRCPQCGKRFLAMVDFTTTGIMR